MLLCVSTPTALVADPLSTGSLTLGCIVPTCAVAETLSRASDVVISGVPIAPVATKLGVVRKLNVLAKGLSPLLSVNVPNTLARTLVIFSTTVFTEAVAHTPTNASVGFAFIVPTETVADTPSINFGVT